MENISLMNQWNYRCWQQEAVKSLNTALIVFPAGEETHSKNVNILFRSSLHYPNTAGEKTRGKFECQISNEFLSKMPDGLSKNVVNYESFLQMKCPCPIQGQRFLRNLELKKNQLHVELEIIKM